MSKCMQECNKGNIMWMFKFVSKYRKGFISWKCMTNNMLITITYRKKIYFNNIAVQNKHKIIWNSGVPNM